MNKYVSLQTFWALFYKEIMVFKTDYWRIVINGFSWTTTMLFSFCFFLPKLGMPEGYGLFMLPGMLAGLSSFDIIGNTTSLIGDVTGEKSIDYDLLLPVPQWLVFLKIACVYAYRSFVISCAILPFGMAFLYLAVGQVFNDIAPFKTLLLLILINLFFGIVGLFAASFMQRISDVRNIWMRVVFPLWWIGGFSYSWQTTYSVFPSLGYIMLLNPFIYINEGIRAAMLGQEQFLNFWICFVVLLITTFILGYVGITKFLKRLDCL